MEIRVEKLEGGIRFVAYIDGRRGPSLFLTDAYYRKVGPIDPMPILAQGGKRSQSG